MRMILLAAAATSLVGCQSMDGPPAQRSAKAQANYDRLLAGKSPGRAETCLPLQRTDDMTVIDDETILYSVGRTTYVNQPPGGCAMLGRGSYTLVTRSSGSRLCRGDIATVVDIGTGTMAGSCAMGYFVPYRALN